MKKDKYGRKVELRTISGRDYVVNSEQKKYTLYKRNPVTGRFLGRYSNVPRRISDNTRYIRMIHSIDINHDKIPDLNVGQVIGRMKRFSSGKPDHVKVNVHISNKVSRDKMKQTQKEKFRKIMLNLKNKRR
ncbi:hypothetical protein M0R04_08945 [Candidatus Dojkabacteria bacterium]|jgi:hypothetical protein|nr:hypothetical protein [Candidatus Dojkabacteria bacterium]